MNNIQTELMKSHHRDVKLTKRRFGMKVHNRNLGHLYRNAILRRVKNA